MVGRAIRSSRLHATTTGQDGGLPFLLYESLGQAAQVSLLLLSEAEQDRLTLLLLEALPHLEVQVVRVHFHGDR